ncbi:DNA-processing protein DprA [Candidatus Saccharibacteria bacterium]|nr:DNA-processing protein DprA [Candidatus Saccharibacteria bacterium]
MNYQKINLSHPFLQILKDIPDPPELLYMRGGLPSQKDRPKTVAIVGSRRSSSYGENIAYKLAYELAKNDVCVISGLAYGIDSVAHRACLDADGITVAVLGTEINKIYPVSHTALARRILKRGAILSEYNEHNVIYPKTSFLKRNRLISGLADAVVIVEAAEHSGTFSTASHALEQGKELFVVPGDITRQNSVGCNRIISQGAQIYTKVDDVLNSLFPKRRSYKSSSVDRLQNLSNKERKIIESMLNGTNDGEEIIEKLKFEPREFNQHITLLEIKGFVKSLGFNHWALTI